MPYCTDAVTIYAKGASNKYLEQGSPTPSLEGQYPAGFSYFPGSTHPNQIIARCNNYYSLLLLLGLDVLLFTVPSALSSDWDNYKK